MNKYIIKCNIDTQDGDNDTVDYTGNLFDNFEDAQKEFEKAIEEANQFGFINYVYITEVNVNEDKETEK